MTAADHIRLELSPDEIEVVLTALTALRWREGGASTPTVKNICNRVLDKIGLAGEEDGGCVFCAVGEIRHTHGGVDTEQA